MLIFFQYLLAKDALEWNWDVGSVIIMKFLQKSNVLSITDLISYIYNQDPAHAQLVLSDLLETEFILLADLLKHINSTDPIGISICDILNEGIKRLCCDVIENPTILMKNYLDELTYLVRGLFETLFFITKKYSIGISARNY